MNHLDGWDTAGDEADGWDVLNEEAQQAGSLSQEEADAIASQLMQRLSGDDSTPDEQGGLSQEEADQIAAQLMQRLSQSAPTPRQEPPPPPSLPQQSVQRPTAPHPGSANAAPGQPPHAPKNVAGQPSASSTGKSSFGKPPKVPMPQTRVPKPVQGAAMNQRTRRRVRIENEWDESKHSRGKDGRFGSGSSGKWGEAKGPTTRLGRIWRSLFGKTPTQPAAGTAFNSPMDCNAVKSIISGKSEYELSAGGLGGSYQDRMLGDILHESSRDDPPHVVSSDELDKLIKEKGWTPMYRALEKAEQTEQFKNGPLYNGSGIYGNGTYTAKQRAWQSGEEKARDEVKGYGTNVMRMAVPPDARIVTHEAIQKERAAYQSQLSKDLDSGKMSMKEYQRMLKVTEDLGRFAALRNYDMIDASSASGHGYCVVLNRSMLAVQKENVK